MDLRKQFSTLLAKPMNRREFILHIGAGLLALVGISGFIKSFSINKEAAPQHIGKIYGSGTYGGKS